MTASSVVFVLLFTFSALAAPEPTYDPDPFGDADFGVGDRQPLVQDVAHDTEGRLEVGTMFSSSVIDKYNSHLGFMVDLTYHPIRTLGFSAVIGFHDGSTTNIIDEVIRENLNECNDPDNASEPCNLNPSLPDFAQLTGSLDGRVVWTPLYGKINAVSEVDANLEFYGFFGVGIHGERLPDVVEDGSEESGFRIDNGDGGLFSDAQFRLSAGTGFKLFLGETVALRTELMAIGWRDSFDFSSDDIDGEAGFYTYRYFLNTGLSFAL